MTPRAVHAADADEPGWLRNAVREVDAEADKLSAEPDAWSGRKLVDRFRTARAIALEVPPDVPWAIARHVAFGSITDLVSPPKMGKTTWWALAVRAVVDGADFMGWSTTQSSVVVLTEQAPTSFRQVLKRSDLAERDDVVVLYRSDARDASWADVVAAAVEVCVRIGARVLVIDTLPAWARIRGDNENDSGTALEAMEPLEAAASGLGLAILVVRHARKGGATEIADAGRGSGAFAGSADILLELRRPSNPPRPTIRILAAASRYDETPRELAVELGDDGYQVLGDQAAVAFEEARSGLLDVLPDDGGLTVSEILSLVGGRRTTLQAALGSLQDAGDVERVGSGRRGDPHRYRRTGAGFLSAGRPHYVGTVPGDLPAENRTPGAPLGMTVAEEMATIFGAEPDSPGGRS